MRIAGVDEVGRGPLAGPVVAAAVILPDMPVIPGLADSKSLTARCRQELARQIKRYALSWAVAEVSVAEIDQLNIFHASLLAMKKAVLSLKTQPDKLMIDGKFVPPGLALPAEAVVKGDTKIAAISAASIIAKVYRDQKMCDLAGDYPCYGFDQHKGYPTRQHLVALQTHGYCPVHRKSFKPVSTMIG